MDNLRRVVDYVLDEPCHRKVWVYDAIREAELPNILEEAKAILRIQDLRHNEECLSPFSLNQAISELQEEGLDEYTDKAKATLRELKIEIPEEDDGERGDKEPEELSALEKLVRALGCLSPDLQRQCVCLIEENGPLELWNQALVLSFIRYRMNSSSDDLNTAYEKAVAISHGYSIDSPLGCSASQLIKDAGLEDEEPEEPEEPEKLSDLEKLVRTLGCLSPDLQRECVRLIEEKGPHGLWNQALVLSSIRYQMQPYQSDLIPAYDRSRTYLANYSTNPAFGVSAIQLLKDAGLEHEVLKVPEEPEAPAEHPDFRVGHLVICDDRAGRIVFMKDEQIVVELDDTGPIQLVISDLRSIRRLTRREIVEVVTGGEFSKKDAVVNQPELSYQPDLEFVRWIVTLTILRACWSVSFFTLRTISSKVTSSPAFRGTLTSELITRIDDLTEEWAFQLGIDYSEVGK